MSAPFNFENHLFISYAHIDNYHFSGSAKGWVDLLHERLEIRLAQLLGKKPTIWRDPELKGNDVFNETIVIELSKTAILLSIISPRYLQSSSCRQELEHFFRLAERDMGVRLDDKHRVFKAVKTYVPLEEHPPELRPDKPLPWKAPALREAVRQYLNQSRLSVHLIGEHYGVIPEMETERSIVRLQQEMAIERGDTHEFSRLIWMPPDLQPKDELQRRFVADLQNSFSSHNGSELLQVKLEDLKTIIQTKLTQKLKPVSLVKERAGAPRLYLICDQQDVDAVAPLQNHLFDRGCEVTLPLLDGTESEVLNDHKENLLLCDAVLIYQGRASDGWLRMKLRDLIKLPGYGRTSPLAAKAIYIGAPESPSKERFKTLDAQVVKNYGEFDAAAIAPLLAQINNAKGA